MKKFLFILVAALIAITPAVASAWVIEGLSAAGYVQGQQQQTLAEQGQGHLGNGVQVQNQSGGNIQGQASANGASTVFTHAQARGANVQGQGYSQTNSQASFGSGPSFQAQGSGQAQSQGQVSGALAVSHFRIP